MNFNTISFVFLFLPAALLAFYVTPHRWRLYVVTAFSFLFYGVSGLIPLALLVSTILWSFFAAFLVTRTHHRGLGLAVAIAFPLGELFLAKYLGFTLTSFGVELSAESPVERIAHLALPAGISFYTFQAVSYLIDTRDGRVPTERSPVKFAAFVSFFPQLIAGPILRYESIRDQLQRIADGTAPRADFATGIKYCAFGLFYKIFFSDILTTIQQRYQGGADAFAGDTLFSVFAYSAIIYFDFWAYSLIAIGLAKFFSIDLPRNFREPYKSRSPREFWRRWHITLSYWLRDYVYLRMGGNQAYMRNIIIVFLLVGLWHGAGWNFVVWGAYHAVLVVGYHVIRGGWDRMPAVIQVAVTFVAVSFGWPLFYLDIGSYLGLYETLLSFPGVASAIYGPFEWLYLAVVLGYIFVVREDAVLFADRPRLVGSPYLHAAMVCGAVMFFSFGKTFIYFQF